MQQEQIAALLAAQRTYFEGGATLPVKHRIAALKRLYRAIKAQEKEIYAALRADLGKSEQESFMCEVGMALSEIAYMQKHVKRLAKPHRVRTPLAQFASKSYQLSVPYGNTLIMSPWNYPFLLTVSPLANAIAAGNTAIVKPSAYSPATSKLLQALLQACFPPEEVSVILGGRQENAALLKQKFDFIFFTGSTAVGKEVLRNAAEHLTPAVLELGGKSPCIVDDTANLKLAAKRIVFGKFLNCGQTCVAPDYVLCDARIKPQLVQEIQKQIRLQYGENALSCPDYGRIVSEKHFTRLLGLIDRNKLIFGGDFDRETLQIAPTVLDNVCFEDAVMQEEIFGPILPILTYDRFEEIFPLLQAKPKPLALYLFSSDKKRQREVRCRIPFGGGCINDTIIHLATSEMGFGGVGESGMGSYHGKAGFAAFSHSKSIVDKKTWLDLPMRYRPYRSRLYRALLHFFLK